jgi:hypothetical protein
MPALNTTITTNGDTNTGWYNGRRTFVYRERVQATTGAGVVTLKSVFPARSKLVAYTLTAATTSTGAVSGSDGAATANGVGVVFGSAAGTQPTTGTAINGVNIVALANGATTTLASSLAGRGDHWFQPGTVTATAGGISGFIQQVKNTSTNDLPIFLIPTRATGSSYTTAFQTDTTFYKFGTGTTTSTVVGADVNVVLYFEQYADNGVAEA